MVYPAQSQMVAVLRLGSAQTSAATASAGTALPVFIDYYRLGSTSGISTTGGNSTLLTSIPLPTVSGVTGGKYTGACTLGLGVGDWDYNSEGLPSNTADGAFGLLPCYDVAVGQPIGADARKTIARLDWRHTVDTTTSGFINNWPRGSTDGWRQVASRDGRSFYTASVAQFQSGFRFIADGSKRTSDGSFASARVFPGTSTTITAGTNDARAIGLYQGRLYAVSGSGDEGWDALFQIGGAGSFAPREPTNSYVRLTTAALGRPWTFAFQSPSQVWIAVEKPTGARGVVECYKQFAPSAGYFKTSAVVLSTSRPVYSLTGRMEGSAFVLYAADRATLYRYDTSSAQSTAATTLATAPRFGAFRGVLFPADVAPSTPTPTASISPAPARPSASRSKTAKRKALRE